MAQLFLIHATADIACAAAARVAFAAAGYQVWQLPSHLDSQSASYASALELGIGGSGAAVLIWSAAAQTDEWVERMLLFAQQLKKPLATLRFDGTELPLTLVDTYSVDVDGDCGTAVEHLLPYLPPATDNDLLLALLAHEHIRNKKQGITEAIANIQRGEQHEQLLAILEHMARHDVYNSVREAAQQALDELRQTTAPQTTPVTLGTSRHTFGVRCAKHHVSWFDKREVCSANGTISRSRVQKAGKDLDQLSLPCRTPGCGETVVVPVDCEGYV